MKSTSLILFAALLFAGGAPTANAQTEPTPKCETPTVNGDPACWLKVENHDDCYIWFDRIAKEMTVTWSGQCPAGVPDGRGKMVFGVGMDGRSRLIRVDIGSIVDGKKHGRWSEENMPEPNEHGFFIINEGSYVNGKRHGEWTHRSGDSSGDVDFLSEECRKFSNGALVSKKDGICDDPSAVAKFTPCKMPTTAGDKSCWLKVANKEDCYAWTNLLVSDMSATWSGRCKAGKLDGHGELMLRWDGGESTSIGSFVDGKPNGQWEDRYANGTVSTGPYVDDKRHGRWEERKADGTVTIAHYVDGKRHGQWEIRSADGTVAIGPFVDDNPNGQWEERYADGSVSIGPFVDGKRNGQWEQRFVDGTVAIGPFVDDEQNGKWEIQYADGTVFIGPYVDGEWHGRWEFRGANGTVEIKQFENGKVVK